MTHEELIKKVMHQKYKFTFGNQKWEITPDEPYAKQLIVTIAEGVNMSERITGVGAITENHGLVALPAPSRHHHIYALGVLMGFDCMPDDGGGFVTDKGRYLTREEAFAMTGKGRNGKTFSEDLW